MYIPRSSHRSTAGFTLLEVLIAMSLLAVLMVLLFGSLRVGVASWDKGEKRAFEAARMAVIQGFLRERLLATLPVTDDFTDDEPRFSFQGKSDSVQFVASMPAAGGRGGLRIFNVERIRDYGEDGLRVTLRPFYPTFDGVDPPNEEVVILEEVEKIAFSYFGADEPGDDAAWQETWEDKSHLPELVRIDIRVRGEPPWPPVVVAPRLRR